MSRNRRRTSTFSPVLGPPAATVRVGSCCSLAVAVQDGGRLARLHEWDVKSSARGARDHAREMDALTSTDNRSADLLLFRAVREGRRVMATQLLTHGFAGRGRRRLGAEDLWELYDATLGDDEPVAVAATEPLGDGRRVRLVAVVVAPSWRGRGNGRRIVEEVCTALRAQGVVALVAAVPVDHAPALVTLRRAGLRPSHVERAGRDGTEQDLVWFDVEL